MVQLMCKSALLFPFFFALSMQSLSAVELNELCSQRAVSTVAELRHQHYPQLSERETEIARKTATMACIDAHSASLPVAINKDLSSTSSDETSSEQNKKSWLEKLLKNEKKEDVSPMMKNHRSGGK